MARLTPMEPPVTSSFPLARNAADGIPYISARRATRAAPRAEEALEASASRSANPRSDADPIRSASLPTSVTNVGSSALVVSAGGACCLSPSGLTVGGPPGGSRWPRALSRSTGLRLFHEAIAEGVAAEEPHEADFAVK